MQHTMRTSCYLTFVAFAAVAQGGDPPHAAPAPAYYPPRQQHPAQALDWAADDGRAAAFALPPWAAKYRPDDRWAAAAAAAAGLDARYYLLAEDEDEQPDFDQIKQKAVRNKRYNLEVYQPRQTRYFNMEEEPSLSINAPIQSLRKVYAKERLRQRIAANRIFLDNLRDSQ